MKLSRILQSALPCYCTPIAVTRLNTIKLLAIPICFVIFATIYKHKIKRYVSKILYRIQ